MTSPRPVLDPELTILAGRDLVGLCGRLVRERSWETLSTLFAALGLDGGLTFVSLADLDAAARLVESAVAATGVPRNPRAAVADELRTLRLTIAEALLARTSATPLGGVERQARQRAAAMLGAGGDHRRSALVYEQLGDDARAAERWGATGEIELMEAALEREERRSSARRSAVDAMRRLEALLTGGERRAALAVAAELSGVEEAASAIELSVRVETRLCRGRAVTLRVRGGPWVRVAGLPASLGRDKGVEIPLRDPSVSRRHALLRAGTEGITIEDAGSRGGVRLAGAQIDAPIFLRGEGELVLGASTPLRFSATRGSVIFEGIGGLDRPLRALCGLEPVPLGLLLPELEGLSLTWSDGSARLLRRSDVTARVDGHFIGPGCDLLHGDVVELVAPRPLQLEIE